MSNESIESYCNKCEGEVKCEWRGRLVSEWYCIQCGTIFNGQPKIFVEDSIVNKAMKDVRMELISYGVVKPEMKIVSKIVMKRLKLGTMSYIIVT